jgi:general secretion pathway protein H
MDGRYCVRHRAAKPAHFFPVREGGFSLVELMVVLFLMGLLAAAVTLAMPGEGGALRDEAQRFAARTVAARDEAIGGARPVALVVGGAGYYFERRIDAGWQPLDPTRFGLVSWKEGTAASVTGGAEAGGMERQRLVFDPVGLASSEARVRLARGGSAMVVRIARDGSVAVDVG